MKKGIQKMYSEKDTYLDAFSFFALFFALQWHHKITVSDGTGRDDSTNTKKRNRKGIK